MPAAKLNYKKNNIIGSRYGRVFTKTYNHLQANGFMTPPTWIEKNNPGRKTLITKKIDLKRKIHQAGLDNSHEAGNRKRPRVDGKRVTGPTNSRTLECPKRHIWTKTGLNREYCYPSFLKYISEIFVTGSRASDLCHYCEEKILRKIIQPIFEKSQKKKKKSWLLKCSDVKSAFPLAQKRKMLKFPKRILRN